MYFMLYIYIIALNKLIFAPKILVDLYLQHKTQIAISSEL